MLYTTREELHALIEDHEVETQQLEFKTYKFPDGKIDTKDKESIAREVVAFANAKGGYIIIGISEEDEHMAASIQDVGCAISFFDQIQLTIKNYLLAKVRPQIYGIQIVRVVLDEKEDRFTITIYVPQSYNRPHAINHNGTKDVFHIRNMCGVDHMSIDELRRQFLSTASLANEIKSFRQERISMIVGNEVLGSLLDGGKLLIHIIPLWSLEKSNSVDLVTVSLNNNYNNPIATTGYYTGYNVDGWFSYRTDSNTQKVASYVQFFRTGIIEAVNLRLMNIAEKTIHNWWNTEQEIFKTISNYSTLLGILNVPKPWYVYISLLDVKGFSSNNTLDDFEPIDRNIVHAIECIIDDNRELSEALKPAFDSLANALGKPKSINYDNAGNYKQS